MLPDKQSTSLDPHLLLETATYYEVTGKTTWRPVASDALAEMLSSCQPPEYRTVLGIIGDMASSSDSWRYRGPLYFDFDGPLDASIDGFQSLLAKLIECGIDLDAVRLFATGGRGFHAEVPMSCFMPVVPAEGVPLLPYIYRAMVESLQTACMDMAIYSAKSGRMWRVPNRRRSNGFFKVPLTSAEAFAVTSESYIELCAAPRAFPPLEAPMFAPELGALFEAGAAKVAAQAELAAHRQANADCANAELLRRFGGQLPPTLAALGRGLFPARGGWNKVAMQFAITAHAVGMDEAALLSACSGLIEKHESDGRYSSPVRRRAELSAQYDYCGQRGYEFSVGGVYSILPQGLFANDLKGL